MKTCPIFVRTSITPIGGVSGVSHGHQIRVRRIVVAVIRGWTFPPPSSPIEYSSGYFRLVLDNVKRCCRISFDLWEKHARREEYISGFISYFVIKLWRSETMVKASRGCSSNRIHKYYVTAMGASCPQRFYSQTDGAKHTTHADRQSRRR